MPFARPDGEYNNENYYVVLEATSKAWNILRFSPNKKDRLTKA